MPCFRPLTGYRAIEANQKTGKYPIVFDYKKGYIDMKVNLPCGQCIGCRLERSRQWATRCVHEAQLYKDNCFITLTYNDKNLPENGSLQKGDFVKFMKRLRKKCAKGFNYTQNGEVKHFQQPDGIRFYQCGEYGENLGRPHYHACIFNFDFPDKYVWTVKEGIQYYRSPILENLWDYGYSSIGAVSFESAAYVARYILKKITGEKSKDHYQDKTPEYTTMSRRPGLGKDWYKKYGETDVIPTDSIIIRGKKCKVPKFYDHIYELTNPDEYGKLKTRRAREARKNPDNEPRRLMTREVIKNAQLKYLGRNLEKVSC